MTWSKLIAPLWGHSSPTSHLGTVGSSSGSTPENSSMRSTACSDCSTSATFLLTPDSACVICAMLDTARLARPMSRAVRYLPAMSDATVTPCVKLPSQSSRSAYHCVSRKIDWNVRAFSSMLARNSSSKRGTHLYARMHMRPVSVLS